MPPPLPLRERAGERGRQLAPKPKTSPPSQHIFAAAPPQQNLRAGTRAARDVSNQLGEQYRVFYWELAAPNAMWPLLTTSNTGPLANLWLSQIYRLDIHIINGDTAAVQKKQDVLTRKKMIEQFETTVGFNIIIMSPVAAGVGLTVVGANHVIHVERHWNPAKEAQATDRVYRIGQKKDVYVHLPAALHPQFDSFDVHLDRLMAVLEWLFSVSDEHLFSDEIVDTFGGLTNLRPRRLQVLLQACTSVRTKRVFLLLARYFKHGWYPRLDISAIDLEQGKRQLVKGGMLDREYQVTVPQRFANAD